MTIGRKLVTVSAVVLGALVIGTSTPETAAPTLPSLTTLKNKSGIVSSAIVDADAFATAAVADHKASNYASAVRQARKTYQLLLAAADAINAKVPSPEKSLRRWHRAKHASFRQYINDTEMDLATHFDARVPTSLPVGSHNPSATKLAVSVSVSVGRAVPDLRTALR